jgi:hypothetical protein
MIVRSQSLGEDSASSTMARGSPTCQCWTPWSGWAAGQWDRSALPCCDGMRPCGWCNSPAGERCQLERVQRQVQGTTRACKLRVLVEALDMLTADIPLVLVLEDLHWARRRCYSKPCREANGTLGG